MAGILLWRLNSSVDLLPPKLSELRFDKFLSSGDAPIPGSCLRVPMGVTFSVGLGSGVNAAEETASCAWPLQMNQP